MTNKDFQRLRTIYGETQLQFGRRLGYDGPDETVKRKVRRYESGETPITGPISALLVLLEERWANMLKRTSGYSSPRKSHFAEGKAP